MSDAGGGGTRKGEGSGVYDETGRRVRDPSCRRLAWLTRTCLPRVVVTVTILFLFTGI